MKSIGSTVCFLPTKAGNPRNGEGSFVRLKDDRIMYVYTKYLGEDWHDHAIAALYVTYSEDEGDTWSTPTLLLEKDEKAENIMSVSLFRMQNGQLGMVYLRKENIPEEGIACMPVFRSSADEGKTWSDYVFCGIPDGYYCVINDGVILQRNGRILVPMSYHGPRVPPVIVGSEKKQADIRFAYSDDNGSTWGMLDAAISTPFDDNLGFAEPGVYEHEDGDIDAYSVGPNAELFCRCSSECICCCQHNGLSFASQLMGNLSYGCCLTATIDSYHKDYQWSILTKTMSFLLVHKTCNYFSQSDFYYLRLSQIVALDFISQCFYNLHGSFHSDIGGDQYFLQFIKKIVIHSRSCHQRISYAL